METIENSTFKNICIKDLTIPDFLEDDRANFKEGRYRTSVNRSYYAALNAARAILILKGANPQTLEGVLTILSLRYIKPGHLPVSEDCRENYKIDR